MKKVRPAMLDKAEQKVTKLTAPDADGNGRGAAPWTGGGMTMQNRIRQLQLKQGPGAA